MPRNLVKRFFGALPPEDSKGTFSVAEDNTMPLTEDSFAQHQAIRPQAHLSGAETKFNFPTAVILVRPNHLPPGMFRNLLHSPTHLPEAGRLKHFLPAWEQIAKDPWILQVVSGYQIEFVDYPVKLKIPAPIPCTQDHQTKIDQEVQELLSKGAIHYVQPNTYQEPGFVSSLFVVPKKGGGR